MKSTLRPLMMIGVIALLATALLTTGCPDEDEDDDSGGMCFYDCSSADGSMSGCWRYETEEECIEDNEDSCAANGFTMNELEYVEGCSMCDECPPDWYEN